MSSTDSPEPPLNCLSCRRRKVRCDRQRPCSNCIKGGQKCVFPTSDRIYQRPRSRIVRQANKTQRSELLDRLNRLESTLDSLNSDLDSQTSAHSQGNHGNGSHKMHGPILPTVSSRGTGSIGNATWCSESRRLHIHQSTITVSNTSGGVYVDNNFWATLRQEIKVVRETFAALENEEADDGGYVSTFLPSYRGAKLGSSFFLFDSHPHEGIEDTLQKLRPLPSQMLFLWQIFVDNVAPILHIFHTPTALSILQDSQFRLEKLDRSMEPLFFVISMLAINSLTSDDVRINFDRDKQEFFAQLRLGTERALTRSNFLNTTSISVVQALILYIFLIRRNESTRHVWSLMGILVRIAASIGLHRDGSHYSTISPFEVENRRRLWWNICCFDDHLGDGQAPQMGISEMDFDTLPPTNVNDADLDPAMTALPVPRDDFTDTSLTLLFHEAWNVGQKIKYVTSLSSSNHLEADAKTQIIFNLLEKFREMANQRVNKVPDNSLRLALGTMLNLKINNQKLAAKHQLQRKLQDSLPDASSFALAVSILEDVAVIHNSSETRRFVWFFHGNLPWQSYAIILSRICSLPWDDRAENAWNLVTKSLGDIPEGVQADPFWQPIRILLNRVHKQREQQLQSQGLTPQLDNAIDSTQSWWMSPVRSEAATSRFPCNDVDTDSDLSANINLEDWNQMLFEGASFF